VAVTPDSQRQAVTISTPRALDQIACKTNGLSAPLGRLNAGAAARTTPRAPQQRACAGARDAGGQGASCGRVGGRRRGPRRGVGEAQYQGCGSPAAPRSAAAGGARRQRGRRQRAQRRTRARWPTWPPSQPGTLARTCWVRLWLSMRRRRSKRSSVLGHLGLYTVSLKLFLFSIFFMIKISSASLKFPKKSKFRGPVTKLLNSLSKRGVLISKQKAQF
jgi:hypothetical protein